MHGGSPTKESKITQMAEEFRTRPQPVPWIDIVDEVAERYDLDWETDEAKIERLAQQVDALI